jgi:hypothetical protein
MGKVYGITAADVHRHTGRRLDAWQAAILKLSVWLYQRIGTKVIIYTYTDSPKLQNKHGFFEKPGKTR